MKLSLSPKLVEKLIFVPVISFCKIFITSYGFDALLCQNCLFLPPNRVTLRRTPWQPQKKLSMVSITKAQVPMFVVYHY
jgi:hypothetical protein